MGLAFPESLIEPEKSESIHPLLPDPNDLHVLAAAIQGGADVLVTRNTKDFPLSGPNLFIFVPSHLIISCATFIVIIRKPRCLP
ncbi:PIN domain-containing protein [Bifidobacterium bifidum]|uniref:PIN domain-containing protein n=1 Tax=Bifidobacterium bifidum TaxID=1681 RepID=UPI0018DB1071|nr:PIN domain-containing protein [Bifidobacterium bifidum]